MTIWHIQKIDISDLNRLGKGSMPEHIGIDFTDVGPDWLVARMPVDQRTKQPWGRLHGGASVVLAETVATVAANLTLDPASKAAVGLEINANHVRPVSSGFVYAKVSPENRGRTTQIWSFRITDDHDRLVAVGRITLAIIPTEVATPAGREKSSAMAVKDAPADSMSRFKQFMQIMARGTLDPTPSNFRQDVG